MCVVQNVARTWIWKPSGKIRPHQVPTALGPNWSNGSAKYSCYKLRSLLSYPPPVHLYHMFFVFGLYSFLIWRLRYPPLSLSYMSLLSWLAMFSDQLFQFASCLCFQQQRSYWGKNRAGSQTALLSFVFRLYGFLGGAGFLLLAILQCVLLCFFMKCYGDCMLLIYVFLADLGV